MSQDAKAELAPTGVLRAGINLSNFLLVTGKSASGDPEGVSPDMAREIATRLGVPVKYVPYKTPGELADMAELVPGTVRAGGRTLAYADDDYREVFRAWRAMYNLASVE